MGKQYATLWAEKFKGLYGYEAQLKHPDRLWLYENAENPVLDVGCGPCIDAKGFQDYVGIDVTSHFLKTAHFDLKVANVIRCDGRALAFHDKVFGTCYAKDTIHHYPFEDALKFMEEMIRVSHTCYVAWGKGYVPSCKPKEKTINGFCYNRFSLSELRKHFKVTRIKGTTIMLIESLK